MSIGIYMCVSFIGPSPPFPVPINLINFLNMRWQWINIVHYYIGGTQKILLGKWISCALETQQTAETTQKGLRDPILEIWTLWPIAQRFRALSTAMDLGRGTIIPRASVSDWIVLAVTVVSDLLKYTQISCDHLHPR